MSQMRADDSPGSSQAKSRTWSKGLPALRLNRRAHAPARRQGRQSFTADLSTPPPRLLRLWRASSGVGLLVVAWAALLLCALLAGVVHGLFPLTSPLLRHFALALVCVAGGLFLFVTALASVVVGSFLLSLSISASGW